MKFLVCFTLLSSFVLASNAAAVSNLSGKMLIFPKETATAHMKLSPTQQRFAALTVCQRFFSDLKRDHALFSMTVPSASGSHGFTIFVTSAPQGIKIFLPNTPTHFLGINYAPNKWHSLCATWSAGSGLGQVWLNGNPLTIKSFAFNSPITGKPIVTLGQDQGSYGGGFVATKSFVGMMSDVHMWDSVLSSCDISKFMKECPSFTPGNVLNWGALDFEIKGDVVIENKQTICTCAN